MCGVGQTTSLLPWLFSWTLFVSQKRNAGQIHSGGEGGETWSQYPQGFLVWLFPG